MGSWFGRSGRRGGAAVEVVPESPPAGAEQVELLRDDLHNLAGRVDALAAEIERSGRQQARAALAEEAAQKALGNSLEQVRALLEARPEPAEAISDMADALRAEARAAAARTLLPVLDSLEESERAARDLAATHRSAGAAIGWGDVVRGAAELTLLAAGGRASAHLPGALRQWADGVALTRRRLEDALAQLGATPIPAVGRPFDPRLHRAVEVRVTAAALPNTVVEQVRRGFMMGDRVLRFADVVVAKRDAV